MTSTIAASHFHFNNVSIFLDEIYVMLRNVLLSVKRRSLWCIRKAKEVAAHVRFGSMLIFYCQPTVFSSWFLIQLQFILTNYFSSVHSPAILKHNGGITSKLFPYNVLSWIKTWTKLTREDQLQFYINSFKGNEINTAKFRRINYKRNSIMNKSIKY